MVTTYPECVESVKIDIWCTEMAETEPDTPLIDENVYKSEKQVQNKDEEIVPPDGGFWVSIEYLEKLNC